MSVPAGPLDETITERLVGAITPVTIELALTALANLEERDREIGAQWRMRIERARYEVDLAERRYEAVDPANRLIAATLETRWNDAMQRLRDLETELAAFERKAMRTVTSEQKRQILELAKDFPRLWAAETTTPRDRKRILRLLVRDITVVKGPEPKIVRLHIRWQGGQAETLQLRLPPNRADVVRYPEAFVEHVRALAFDHHDEEIVALLHGEARGLFYILGVRERSDKLVRELVLDDPAPFIPLTIAKRDKDIDYEAKAVALAGRRYIVCRNREEMKKHAAARAAILAALERQLKKGDKSLVGNKGYRRFLATPDDDHFVIDRAKAEEDAKFDGIFVLRTNTDLSPLDAMLCYKRLWMVERAFRTSKSLFATRPIFHKLDETIRGHVSCSFLALVLKKELEDRIANLGLAGSWPEILADLELVDRDRGRTGRQTLSVAHAAAPRRQPRPARHWRRPAANRAATRRRLIKTHAANHRKCSAKPFFRNGLCRMINALQIRTVEDQSSSKR